MLFILWIKFMNSQYIPFAFLHDMWIYLSLFILWSDMTGWIKVNSDHQYPSSLGWEEALRSYCHPMPARWRKIQESFLVKAQCPLSGDLVHPHTGTVWQIRRIVSLHVMFKWDIVKIFFCIKEDYLTILFFGWFIFKYRTVGKVSGGALATAQVYSQANLMGSTQRLFSNWVFSHAHL